MRHFAGDSKAISPTFGVALRDFDVVEMNMSSAFTDEEMAH